MVARIAPSPIVGSVASGDALSHANVSPATPPSVMAGSHEHPDFAPVRQDTAQANMPPSPPPPGEAFAAAIIAGQLPPRPVTAEQLRQRLGGAWQPPASTLRLMDRRA